jgi:hypothetical protein
MKRFSLALFLSLVGWAAVASAKTPSKKAAAEAQKHYDAGIAAYRAGQYEQAITELEAGYALKPDPDQLYNLGQACRLARKPERALEYYRKYLDEVPDAENKAAVEQRIADVEKELEKKNPPPPPPPEPRPVIETLPAGRGAGDAKPPRGVAEVKAKPGFPTTPYQLGVRIRPLFVTSAMLAPYLDARTSMETFSVGIEFIYHRRTFDVVTSLDFSWLDVHDGNYLGKGNPPDLDTKFTEFRGLSFLSADVSIIGHYPLTRWLELRGGAGLGIGVVFGDVLVTTNWTNCNAGNVNDIAQCHPVGVDLTAPNREEQLAATEAPGQRDTAQTPHRHVASEKPPAMAVVNILMGFRFILHPRVTMQVEGGFRNAAFVGVGAHYLF